MRMNATICLHPTNFPFQSKLVMSGPCLGAGTAHRDAVIKGRDHDANVNTNCSLEITTLKLIDHDD